MNRAKNWTERKTKQKTELWLVQLPFMPNRNQFLERKRPWSGVSVVRFFFLGAVIISYAAFDVIVIVLLAF